RAVGPLPPAMDEDAALGAIAHDVAFNTHRTRLDAIKAVTGRAGDGRTLDSSRHPLQRDAGATASRHLAAIHGEGGDAAHLYQRLRLRPERPVGAVEGEAGKLDPRNV